jgi:predicted kinase
MPKLILLNGFASCGKTTLATKYINEHPLALSMEIDHIIHLIGQWKQNYQKAHECRLAIAESITKTHLLSGYDVILPFLLTDEKQAESYEKIAQEVGASFFEIMLDVKKEEAVSRLLKRGKWGEEGLPPLTERDRPEIEKFYDKMARATSERPRMINIYPKENEINETYQMFLSAIHGKEEISY